MKDFFKTLGKGLVALALIGGLATGGYYLGTAISADKVTEQPDNPGADIDVENEPFMADLTPLGLDDSNFVYSNKIDGGYIVSSSRKGFGIWFCDEKTKELTQLYFEGQSWSDFFTVDGGCLISGGDGVLLFKTATHEIVKLLSGTSKWFYLAVDTGVFLNSSVEKCLYFYNNATHEIDLTSFDGLDVSTCFPVEGGYLFPHVRAGDPGISFYDIYLHSFTDAPYHEGYSWSNYQSVDGGYLVSSNAKACEGLLLYDNSTRQFSKIYDLGYSWSNFYSINGGFLISSSSLKGMNSILFYDENTKEVTSLDCDLYGNLIIKSVDGGYLVYRNLTTSVTSSIYFFDEVSHELSQLHTCKFKELFYIEVDDGYIIHNIIDGDALAPIMLHYLNESHSIDVVYEATSPGIKQSLLQKDNGLIFGGYHHYYFLDFKTLNVVTVLYDFE